MPGFFDWISNGISTATQPFTNWLQDSRNPDLTRPRAASLDPTQAIDSSGSLDILNFPHDRPKYYMTFAFEEYSRPSQFQGLQSSGLTDYICLPLPNNMKDENAINYSSTPGHIAAEALAMSGALQVGSVGELASKLTTAAGDYTGSASQGVAGWGIHKIVDGLRKAETFGPMDEKGLTDSLLQTAGLADNPFMTVALKGPMFKQHSFAWRLAAKSEAESQTIKKIVNTFKKMMYPELLNLGAGGFFKYPHIVWPKFQPDGVIDYTYKFKPCVIVAMNVNHTPNDRPGFFPTEAPVEVVIELQLMEIELWRGGDNATLDQGKLPTIVGDFNDVLSPPGRKTS